MGKELDRLQAQQRKSKKSPREKIKEAVDRYSKELGPDFKCFLHVYRADLLCKPAYWDDELKRWEVPVLVSVNSESSKKKRASSGKRTR